MIALILPCPDLSAGGGTERQFADAFDLYQEWAPARYDVRLVVDDLSYRHLRAVGKLRRIERVLRLRCFTGVTRTRRGLVPLLTDPREWFVEVVRKAQRKAELGLVTAQLLRVARRFDLVHLCQPHYLFFPALHLLSLYPEARRPRIAISVTDCALAHRYLRGEPAADGLGLWGEYGPYFNAVKLDGILTWYDLFKQVAERTGVGRGRAVIWAGQTCFVDVARFRPAARKEDVVVYAARLVPQKRPLLFVEAVKVLRETEPHRIKPWRFRMFGDGPLAEAVRHAIWRYGLGDVLDLAQRHDLADEFSRSKLFVSTQDFDNFTSLSMLEAMACGNAVVARNVGQTHYFVQDGVNGYLAQDDAPQDVAAAILRYVQSPQHHSRMQAESIRLATQVYTSDRFLEELEAFWTRVLETKPTKQAASPARNRWGT